MNGTFILFMSTKSSLLPFLMQSYRPVWWKCPPLALRDSQLYSSPSASRPGSPPDPKVHHGVTRRMSWMPKTSPYLLERQARVSHILPWRQWMMSKTSLFHPEKRILQTSESFLCPLDTTCSKASLRLRDFLWAPGSAQVFNKRLQFYRVCWCFKTLVTNDWSQFFFTSPLSLTKVMRTDATCHSLFRLLHPNRAAPH